MVWFLYKTFMDTISLDDNLRTCLSIIAICLSSYVKFSSNSKVSASSTREEFDIHFLSRHEVVDEQTTSYKEVPNDTTLFLLRQVISYDLINLKLNFPLFFCFIPFKEKLLERFCLHYVLYIFFSLIFIRLSFHCK